MSSKKIKSQNIIINKDPKVDEIIKNKIVINKDPKVDEIIKNKIVINKDPIVEIIISYSTEDTGKQFEMAICLAYDIPYDGTYKYSMEVPEKLKPRLSKLVELFPKCFHTASKGSRYDFTSIDKKMHLSAKSTKKGVGKVAPQVIGQAQPEKFCSILNIEYTNNLNLKQYIQTNITTILPILLQYTFDCPNIFYNKSNDTIKYITLIKPIDWNLYNFIWSCNWDKWKNSSLLKIKYTKSDKYISLVEIQFHTKSRTNMAIRWCYETLLDIFKENFNIIHM